MALFNHNGSGPRGTTTSGLVLTTLPRGRALILTTQDGRTWLKHRRQPHTEAEARRIADLLMAQDPGLRLRFAAALGPDDRNLLPPDLTRPDTRIL